MISRLLICAFATLFLVFVHAGVQAADVLDQPPAGQWDTTANIAEKLLELPAARQAEISTEQWEDIRLKLAVDREAALETAERPTLRGNILQRQLAELSSTSGQRSEPAWIAEKRASINAALSSEQRPVSDAREAHARASVLIEAIDRILHRRHRQELFAQDHSLFQAETWQSIADEIATAGRPQPSPRAMPPARSNSDLGAIPLPIRIGLAVAVSCCAFWAASRCRAWLHRWGAESDDLDPRRRLGLAFLRDLLDIAVPAAVLLTLLLITRVLDRDIPILAALAPALLQAGFVVIFARWLGRSLFSPAFPSAQLLVLPSSATRSAIRLFAILGLCLGVEQLIENVTDLPGKPPAFISPLTVTIIIMASSAMWKLARILQLAGGVRSNSPKDGDALKQGTFDLLGPSIVFMKAIAIIAPLSSLSGFVSLSRYFLASALITFAVAGTGLFLFRSLTEATALLFHKRHHPELRYSQLFPLLFGFVLIVCALPMIAVAWGMSAEAFVDAVLALRNGIPVGDIRLSFGSILTFGLVFLLGYLLTRWLQKLLHYTVLNRLGVDPGARSAILTAFGYIGLALAAAIAITSAGLDLSSLAFVAGALSVGIGFGLQSVVSNFVSGIILLIERPIKEGDWIEVAGFSGHVRRIAFRSTHIETFDAHEVIIPNSELVSGSVTNLTYGGSQGRVTLEVGIAYGSDLVRARSLLIELVSRHPRILASPTPNVVVDKLGESAINLKLLCFVENVNSRLTVRSDLYAAILTAFAENEIEIPFPQRELRMRDAVPAGAKLSEMKAMGGEQI